MGATEFSVDNENAAVYENRSCNEHFSRTENTSQCVVVTCKGNDAFFRLVNYKKGYQRNIINQLLLGSMRIFIGRG